MDEKAKAREDLAKQREETAHRLEVEYENRIRDEVEKYDNFISHARTVVRECCKGDDESLWERGKFDPSPPKNPLTDGHQNLCR